MRLNREQKRRIVILRYETSLVDTIDSVLTNEQRREIYLKIANRFRKNPDYKKFMANKRLRSEYLCDNLAIEFHKVSGYLFGNFYIAKYLKVLFPEFELFRPKKIKGLGWWEESDKGLAIRADVMELCAEMCK